MTQKEINAILSQVQKYEPCIRYWIFQQYIKDINNIEYLEFLMEEIKYEIHKLKSTT